MMVSLASKRLRKSPGTKPHSAPPIIPANSIAGNSKIPGALRNQSTIAVPKMAPMNNCPSAPTETSPSRAGRMVASAHSRIGAVFTSVSDSE